MRTDAFIASRTIDLNKPVGTITGQAGVTDNGAATYSIPITVPLGTNCLQPSVAIGYTSFGGDGHLGIGWNLSASSAIIRVGSDSYHDGGTNAIDFTASDRFALDGQRLVPGTSLGLFDTEAASYSIITSEGSFGSGPAGFKAITKNGLTYYYGNCDGQSDAAIVKNNTATEALGWYLAKVQDQFGNYMRYYYSDEGTATVKRLTDIEYTMNDELNIPAYNHVEFKYDQRTDDNIVYVRGTKLESIWLLEEVNVFAEEQLMKQYVLKYAERQQNTSYLSEILEIGSEGGQLNSTIFKYGDIPQKSNTMGLYN